MCTRRSPIHCIIPPHILRALAESDNPQLRAAAMRTLLTSTRIRAQREIIGGVRAAIPAAAPGDKHRTIHDANHKILNQFELPGQLVRDEGRSSRLGDSTVDEAYAGLSATYDFYADVLKRNSIDDRGMRLVATVHFGEGYNNAFWNGQQMVFGDGDGTIFTRFTRSLDVIGHELTHGVTDFTAGLEYRVQSGALNESFSDVFGSLVKQYARHETADAADWLIGADLLAAEIDGMALRSLKDPGSAYNDPRFGGKDPQPKHMQHFLNLPDDEWNDWGGVHINSGIPNHAFYLVAQQLGGYAWEEAGAIWYGALQQLWRTAQFADCANVTIQVAATLYGTDSQQRQAVEDAWYSVGVSGPSPVTRAKRERTPKPDAERADGALKRQLERLSKELRRTAERMV